MFKCCRLCTGHDYSLMNFIDTSKIDCGAASSFCPFVIWVALPAECIEKREDAEHPFAVPGKDMIKDPYEAATRGLDDERGSFHYSPRKPTQAQAEKLQKQTSETMRRTMSRKIQVHPAPGTPATSTTETGPLVSAEEA